MKFVRLLLFLLYLAPVSIIWGQVSHGGSPLFPTNHLLRSSAKSFFIEMPSFNVDSLLQEDRLNEGNMRRSFRFAHKFFTDIERGKSGNNYTLSDGTKVWQVGIRSVGAYSINLLFSKYYLPEGGKLFIYNSDKTQIIGSFTDKNNSENNILPIQPVQGDEIIVEYTEPANAAFEGQLKITEVNHDYLDFRGREPATDPSNSACMKDIVCAIPDNPNVNSTLLIVIDGIYACTGTLLNNTAEDGSPLLLTATHCLNEDFTIKNPDYEKVAGTIVAFFNYQRSICGVKSKGVEEMTIAGARKACVIDTLDIALLHFNETPPDYYLPYYSGWSIEYDGSGTTISINNYPYLNIHHPSAASKKTGHFDSKLTLTSASFTEYKFMPYSHWLIRGWTEGSTAAGSSGSPLFDSNHRIVGGLSGGSSTCSGNNPDGKYDYFFTLFKGWVYGNDPSNQLKTYLDPKNSGATHLDGFDLYKSNPLTRLSNANYNASIPDTLIQTSIKLPATGFLYGQNSLGTIIEFAEEFQLNEKAQVVGAYIFVPPLNRRNTPANVKIHLYSGINGPSQKISSLDFRPSYISYNSGQDTTDGRTMSLASSECFVKFPDEIEFDGKFYISYEITYPSDTLFSVHNTAFSTSQKNTAWMKETSSGQWIQATDYNYQPMATSLAIQPLVRFRGITPIEEVEVPGENKIRFDRFSRILTVVAEENESGQIVVYSIQGQILEKILYKGKTSVSLSARPSGTIGIIRVVSGIKSYSDKVIY